MTDRLRHAIPAPPAALLALAALTAAAAPATAQQANEAAALIEQRMQRIYDDSAATADADAAGPASPPEPATPRAADPPDAGPGSRRLPQPGDADAGITNQLVSREANRNGEGRNSPALPGGDTDPTAGGWIMNTLAALGVIIALILGLRWGYTKVTGQTTPVGHSRAVEPLSRTAIAPKNHVLLLRVGRRVLVVNDSAHGMRTLAQLDDPDEVAELLESVTAAKPGSMSGSFNGLLAKFANPAPARGRGAAIGRDTEFDLDRDELTLPDEGRDRGEHDVDRARDQLSQLLARVRGAGSVGRGGGR